MTTAKTGQKVRKIEVSSDREGQRLDNFIAAQLPGVPRSVIYRVIRKGQVRVNGGRARPDLRLSLGDEVRIPPARVSPSGAKSVPAQVVQQLRDALLVEQEDFVVLDKPAGLAVHGGSGVRWGAIDALRRVFPEEAIELAHRLDRETSGCLLVARNLKALRQLRAQFKAGTVEKRYFCLTQAPMREDRIVVDEPLLKTERGGEWMVEVSPQGKPARTEFRLLEHYGRHSFVEALPATGRTHQIRVHAAQLGLALAGDAKYGEQQHLKTWRRKGLERLFLHAHGLRFDDPAGDSWQVNAPLPDELRKVLDAL
jgi:23S rRNA pseudouridine955/2504/2580 synthase